MTDIAEQKCPNCGGPMRFEPETGKLVCDHCLGEVEITQKAEKAEGKTTEGSEHPTVSVEGFDFDALGDQALCEDAQDLPVYHCVSCGAEVIAPAEQMALTCPYCANNIVLTDKVSGKLRPDGVIPFRITSKELPAAVNRFYKKKKLLPKGFFGESQMGKVTGVYVPFWLFGGDLSGRLKFSGCKSSSSRSGDYIITTTKHYSLTRDAQMSFENVPVDASGKVDDKLMDSLEPFRVEDMQEFDMRYLAGFTADRFDQPKSRIAGRAQKRMRTSAENVVQSNVGGGYHNVRQSGGSLQAKLSAKYVLFPVYMFDLTHGNKRYHFAVNGQSGKVVGNLPIDKKTSALYFWRRVAIVSGLMIAYSVVNYFMGG
ncbi:MAG: TFIIB-type zinc ribbon-containing protein [Lachnospiraceae bacterium]|nr:TFIIB-type zinc ribbon-containing protein [Lachnospiraceae bacterium]